MQKAAAVLKYEIKLRTEIKCRKKRKETQIESCSFLSKKKSQNIKVGILCTIFFIIIQRLYWADSGLNQVASYDLDLDMTSVVYKQQSANFYGISIFKVSHLLQFVNY